MRLDFCTLMEESLGEGKPLCDIIKWGKRCLVESF